MAQTASVSLLERAQSQLGTHRFGKQAEGYRKIDSTNARARAWAKEGAAEGSLVLAEAQTQGRGRMGRTWHARSGQNLLFSLVLRPSLPAKRLGLVTLAAGVAVCEALETFVPRQHLRIRWPNDVLASGRKCCGMLLESAMEAHAAAQPLAVVLGIGLNVNQDTFPDALRTEPTSLLLETGRHASRAELLVRLLTALEHWYDRLLQAEEGPRAVLSAYEARLALGQNVRLEATGTPGVVQGTVAGVTAEGALQVRTPQGLRAFHAGEVTSKR